MAAKNVMTQCINCKHGTFMQWMKNPVICECNITKERYVAEAKKICPLFEFSNNKDKEITHYDSY